MTLRTSSATRRNVVSRSSVVLTTSATSNRKGSTWVGAIVCAGPELTTFILAAASGRSAHQGQVPRSRDLGFRQGSKGPRSRKYLAGCDSAQRSPVHIRPRKRRG